MFRATMRICSTGRRHSSTLFDQSAHAQTRLPLGQAISLPSACYTSREWQSKEVEQVLRAGPTLVGRLDELPESGSYISLDAPGHGPVFVMRGRDMKVRAFANVCRHRGAKLLTEPQGRVKGGIVCPYHAWTFSTNGDLKGAPRMCKSFNKSQWPLIQLRIDEVKGFLFLNKSDSPPLEDSLGNLPELILDKWPLDDMVTVARREYEVGCNWKFLFENTSETYHTSVVHRKTLGPMESSSAEEILGVKPSRNWDAVHVPGSRSVVPLASDAAPFPEIATTTFFTNIFPSVQLNLTRDCAWWMRMLPTAIDKTQVSMGFLFPKSTTERPNFQEELKPYLHRWHLAVVEDNEISENQTAGAQSGVYQPGPYSMLEFGTHKFNNYVLDGVLGEEDSTPPTADTPYQSISIDGFHGKYPAASIGNSISSPFAGATMPRVSAVHAVRAVSSATTSAISGVKKA